MEELGFSVRVVLVLFSHLETFWYKNVVHSYQRVNPTLLVHNKSIHTCNFIKHRKYYMKPVGLFKAEQLLSRSASVIIYHNVHQHFKEGGRQGDRLTRKVGAREEWGFLVTINTPYILKG